MKVRIETYWSPKKGSDGADYEDAFAPDATMALELEDPSPSLAIADGATETSYSREWANKLVEAYAKKPGRFYRDTQLQNYLQELGSDLHHQIRRRHTDLSVPWYVEQKAQEGAFAALLGLTIFEHNERLVWRAFAVGDCCVFQIRQGGMVKAFPLQGSTGFNNHPCLLASRPDRNRRLTEHRQRHTGEWRQGDDFFLMSDALACWFLRRRELSSDPLEFLLHVHDDDEFQALIEREREDRLEDGRPFLQNDDVTLVRCHLGGA